MLSSVTLNYQVTKVSCIQGFTTQNCNIVNLAMFSSGAFFEFIVLVLLFMTNLLQEWLDAASGRHRNHDHLRWQQCSHLSWSWLKAQNPL